MEDSKVIELLGDLIKEGEKLKEKLFEAPIGTWTPAIEHNRLFYEEAEQWRANCINLLNVRLGSESYFYKRFEGGISIKYHSAGRYCKENVGTALGVLRATLEAIKSGLTKDLFYQRELILFEDLLSQAYEFLDQKIDNFDLISLVYGRIVLESTIKEFAKSKGLKIENLKFENIIQELKKSGIITKQFEHSLRANYSLGGSFHNLEEFRTIKREQIRIFLDFIRDNVLTMEI